MYATSTVSVVPVVILGHAYTSLGHHAFGVSLRVLPPPDGAMGKPARRDFEELTGGESRRGFARKPSALASGLGDSIIPITDPKIALKP